MSEQKRQSRQPARKPGAKRRNTKRDAGKPVLALTLIAALLVGGVGGYVVARISSPSPAALARAEARVAELENTVEMMGYQVDDGGDVDAFFMDEELNDFGGADWDAGGDWPENAWNDDGLLGGMITDAQDDTVVAEFDGGAVTLGEISGPYNEALAGGALEFAAVDGDADERLMEVIRQAVSDKLERVKAEEMGLADLTDADKQAIEAQAKADYEDLLLTYSTSVDTAGMSEAEARAAVESFVNIEVGFTLEGLIAERTADYWKTKLYDAVTADVAATEEEIQAAYDTLVDEQRRRFTESTDDFEACAYNDMVITWIPEGYRRVKHVLFPFRDAQTAAQAEAMAEEIQAKQNAMAEVGEILALQAELDKLYVDVDAEAEKVLEEVAGGLDFDEAIARYGRDPDMLREPGKTRGYYVSADSTSLFSQEFIDACMTMETVGSVSVPVHSVEGAHIIRYIGDAAPGAVPLDEVRDRIETAVLSEKRDAAYRQALENWMDEANVRYYPERA